MSQPATKADIEEVKNLLLEVLERLKNMDEGDADPNSGEAGYYYSPKEPG
jgi:hypothetical protein